MAKLFVHKDWKTFPSSDPYHRPAKLPTHRKVKKILKEIIAGLPVEPSPSTQEFAAARERYQRLLDRQRHAHLDPLAPLAYNRQTRPQNTMQDLAQAVIAAGPVLHGEKAKSTGFGGKKKQTPAFALATRPASMPVGRVAGASVQPFSGSVQPSSASATTTRASSATLLPSQSTSSAQLSSQATATSSALLPSQSISSGSKNKRDSQTPTGRPAKKAKTGGANSMLPPQLPARRLGGGA